MNSWERWRPDPLHVGEATMKPSGPLGKTHPGRTANDKNNSRHSTARLAVKSKPTAILQVMRDTLISPHQEGAHRRGAALAAIIDGRLVVLLTLAAGSAKGKKIETIVKVWRRTAAPSAQQAVIEYGGFQCGICTPGQIMAAKALLDENAKPSEEEVKEWMSGNLCRCTGYYKILESVMAVVDGKTDPDYAFRKRETTAKIQSLDVYKPVAKTS